MQKNSSFPQDWPSYLSVDAQVQPLLDASPLGTCQLSFEKMDYVQFEQFCWYLLKKDYHLDGCLRIGDVGNEQDGFDIFAHQKSSVEQMVVFECKCWKNFTSDKLAKTVKRFLSSDWVSSKPKFILILSQQTIGSLKNEWIRAKQLLTQYEIESEIWFGEDLTLKVQYFPDILAKFFPCESTSQFCNEWMRRVEFLERLSKALVDPRKEISEIAKDFLINESERQKLENRYVTERIWKLDQPWFEIYTILPSEEFPAGSASIVIKTPDAEGVTVVLNHNWMLQNFLGQTHVPIATRYRPFYIGEVDENSNRHIIELNHCRLILPLEGVKEIVRMTDELSNVYFSAMRKLDDKWETHSFPFIKWVQTAAVIGSLRKDIWDEICNFTRAHDYNNGTSHWHMFDHSEGALKPFTNASNANYDSGYHGIFYVIEKEHLCRDDEVIIVWQPPDRFGRHKISRRNWWSCNHTFHWLRDELLPAVALWSANERAKRYLFKKEKIKRNVLSYWKRYAALGDIRIQSLIENEDFSKLGVIKVVRDLQFFYSSTKGAHKAYFDEIELKNLLKILISVLKKENGDVGYIRSSLSIYSRCETHLEIIEVIEKRISQKKLGEISLDFTFRAMLEAIGGEEKWIDDLHRVSIFKALRPFMEVHDLQMLVKRHTEYL